MTIFNIATLIASASAAFVVAAPASASADTASAAAVAPAGSNEQRQASPPKKYCVTVEAATGSRLSQRKCRTKEEWEALGVEISTAK